MLALLLCALGAAIVVAIAYQPMARPAVYVRPNAPQIVPQPAPAPVRPALAEPAFVEVPAFRATTDDSVLADVIAHSKDEPYGGDRATNAHETGHGIHAWMRNNLGKGRRVNGFYVLDGRGILVDEPNLRKSQANQYVPEALRGYRWKLYMAGQTAWDDTPLYLCDEWSAYILGAMCNLDDVRKGRHKSEWTDGVSGCLEFAIYCTGLAMAVAEHDPDYWQSNEQFRRFMGWQLREAEAAFAEGAALEQFKWDKQDRQLAALQTDPSGEAMRAFLAEHFDNAFVRLPPPRRAYEPWQQRTLKARLEADSWERREITERHYPRRADQ